MTAYNAASLGKLRKLEDILSWYREVAPSNWLVHAFKLAASKEKEIQDVCVNISVALHCIRTKDSSTMHVRTCMREQAKYCPQVPPYVLRTCTYLHFSYVVVRYVVL